VATALYEDAVELDLNHPMAGKDLEFTVTVLSIRPATEDELAAGQLNHGCDDGCADGCSDGCCS